MTRPIISAPSASPVARERERDRQQVEEEGRWLAELPPLTATPLVIIEGGSACPGPSRDATRAHLRIVR